MGWRRRVEEDEWGGRARSDFIRTIRDDRCTIFLQFWYHLAVSFVRYFLEEGQSDPARKIIISEREGHKHSVA